MLNDSTLKVPKRENVSLVFFTLREPIWLGDLGTEPKIPFFYHLTPDFERFWFFDAYRVCSKRNECLKILRRVSFFYHTMNT